MSDLAERGREIAGSLRRGRWLTNGEEDHIEATADELTALRSQVSELRADLEVAVECITEARDQLWHLAKDPANNPWVKQCDATLNTIRKDG